MPSANSYALGPNWLCCACCVFWQLPVPALLFATHMGTIPAGYLVLSPLLLMSARHSLHILVTGRAPNSVLAISMRVLGAAAQIWERRTG